MSEILLSKLAVTNLASVLKGMAMGIEELVTITARRDSGRPYVVLGPPDEYGNTPKLVLDDADMWNLEGVPA